MIVNLMKILSVLVVLQIDISPTSAEWDPLTQENRMLDIEV